MPLFVTAAYVGEAAAQEPAASQGAAPVRAMVRQYCLDCHSAEEKTAGLALDTIGGEDVSRHTDLWEKVVRKLRVRQMPPADSQRPDEKTYAAVIASLEGSLDKAAAEHPNPGRTETLRRLTRTEYQNAIRDLLALEVDVSELLPADELSHGFDNVTVGELSPTLLDRYITAAQKISGLAVGSSGESPGGDTFRMKADVTQEEHVPGLPLGTRGGMLIPYNFPQTGEYEVQVRLARDRNEEVEGLSRPHELELLLDRRNLASFLVKPPADGTTHAEVDAGLRQRIKVDAGPHKLGVTFVKQPSSLLETRRQPYQAHYNMHRHPRLSPAVYQVSITGPFSADGPGDTPSRRRIFVCRPTRPKDEEACAKQILAPLVRRAYRRPVTDADLERPLALFREARADGDFDAAIEIALSAVLVNPQFLFRIEREPTDTAPGSVYRISDLELASRLSFFLWSSIPDDELLDAAIAGQLSQRPVLKKQVRRMLADRRSHSLVTSFAGQWLHLRNLEAMTPDLRRFPDFDDNLRQAMRQETQSLLAAVLREDRSVLDLLKADHTYLNERLAKHYGIPHVYGTRFRRVPLADDSERGGLLKHGSILTVTSYATRTSPVIRGKWILENLMGTPPPPPLPDVPALKDNTVAANLTVRERLSEHRAQKACASCHDLMDPIGFSLENFDAVGRWRTIDEGQPIDASGGLMGGEAFVGVGGLERALLKRPEIFVGTLTEKLLTFALGRGIEPYDAPAIRQIVRDAKADEYRFSSLIEGIATSVPFQMRKAQ
jgi:mono/diheme cytochrome c family protein